MLLKCLAWPCVLSSRHPLPPEWQELELCPGDTILIPAGWWHAVDNDPSTLAFAFDLVHA